MSTAINRKKGVIVQLAGSYTNTLFAIISGLVFVPMYFRYFDISVYGAWLASGNVLNLLSILEGGMAIVVSQRLAVAFGEGAVKRFAVSTSSGLVVLSLLGLLIFIGGFLISFWVPGMVNADRTHFQDIRLAFILAAAGAALAQVHAAILFITRAWHSNETPTIVSLVAAIVGLVVIFISLKYFGFGVAALGLGACMRNVVNVLGTGSFVVLRWQKMSLPSLSFNRHDATDMLKASLPLFGSNLLGSILNNSRELLLAILINPASVVILSITGRIFSLVTTIINPICFAFFSALASISNVASQFKRRVDELFGFYNWVSSLLFCLTLIINSYFVAVWVGADKFGGVFLSVLLCLSTWLTTKCNMFIIVLNASGTFTKTAIISTLDLIGRVALIGLVYLLGFEFQVFFLPAVECITITVSVFLLSRALARQMKTSSPGTLYLRQFFAIVGASVIVAMLAYTSFQVLGDVLPLTGWYKVMVYATVSFILIFSGSLLVPVNRTIGRELLNLINRKKNVSQEAVRGNDLAVRL